MKARCPLLPALLMPGVGVLFSLAIVISVLMLVPVSRKPSLALLDRSFATSVSIGVVAGLAVVIVFGCVLEPMVEQATGSRVDLSALMDIAGDGAAFLFLLAFGLLFGGSIEEMIFGFRGRLGRRSSVSARRSVWHCSRR